MTQVEPPLQETVSRQVRRPVAPSQPAQARRPMAILQVFTSWRMACVLLTGFASGLPLGLVGKSLQAWLTRAGVDVGTIGIFAVVTLPYTLKFLWSPLMDRFVPPFLGRRRGWMTISQVALVGGICAMALTGVSDPWLLGLVSLVVAWFSATQDIAVDAYRTELLGKEELGAGVGLYILGYRGGLIMSGAVAMVLVQFLGWQGVYMLMAGVMGLTIVTTLLSPEPIAGIRVPQSLKDAVVLPFLEFLHRRGAIEMLVFILIYKFDWAMVDSMMTTFMMKTGFSEGEIGVVANGAGVFATVLGAMIGGAVITAIGIRKSLWTFGLLQGMAGLSFTILAILGKNYTMMTTAILVESICSGMATAAFMGFMMSLCNKQFTATQLSLLTSLMALGRMLAGMGSGILQKQVGWPAYFIIATLIAIPGLVLLLRYDRWQDGASAGPAGAGVLS